MARLRGRPLRHRLLLDRRPRAAPEPRPPVAGPLEPRRRPALQRLPLGRQASLERAVHEQVPRRPRRADRCRHRASTARSTGASPARSATASTTARTCASSGGRAAPAGLRARAGGLAAAERTQGRGLREVPHANRTRAARRRSSVSRRRARPATRTRTPDASATRARRCHDDVKWGNLKLDGFDHGKARYPLKGAHIKTPCAKCHAGQPPKYAPLPFANCTDCHKDAHNGKLGTTCTSCHVEDAWSKVTVTHQAHPGVSLANGHAPVACATCHDKGNKAAPSKGRRAPRAIRPFTRPRSATNCATCHATIKWMGLPAEHRSERARTHRLSARRASTSTPRARAVTSRSWHATLATGSSSSVSASIVTRTQHKGEFASAKQGECAPCHATAGSARRSSGPPRIRRRSSRSTARTSSVACVGCHTDPRPRVSLHVSKQACADCHQNPHGRPVRGGDEGGGCAQCHITASWGRAKFDHSTWPLTGVHATAQCESCHHPTPEDRKQGKGASYRGVPRTCGGCHDDIHVAQFRSQARSSSATSVTRPRRSRSRRSITPRSPAIR